MRYCLRRTAPRVAKWTLDLSLVQHHHFRQGIGDIVSSENSVMRQTTINLPTKLCALLPMFKSELDGSRQSVGRSVYSFYSL